MTFAGVLQRGLAVEFLPAFLELERLIAVIFSRIARVIDIAHDLDLDAAESVDHPFEAVEIDHRVVVDGLAGDFSHAFAEDIGTAPIIQADLIERVQLGRESCARDRGEEVTGEREESDALLLRVDREEHDGIGQVAAGVLLTGAAEEEDIDAAAFLSIEALASAEE